MVVSVLASAVVHPLGCDEGTLESECRASSAATTTAPLSVCDHVLRNASHLNEWDELRMDRFSQLAIAAARKALVRSELPPKRVAECGILVGNMLAGWTFTEPQLRNLHTDGLSSVSPYVAVAWFPAAAQGEVSIRLGLHGYSKTITTDRCAGSQAIGLAYHRIRSGRLGMLLAGGVEAPVAPIVIDAYKGSGGTGRLSEGAALVVLAAGRKSAIRIGAYESAGLHGEHHGRSAEATSRLLAFVRSLPARYPVRLVICNTPPEDGTDPTMAGMLASAASGHADGEPPESLFTTRGIGECFAASGAIGTAIAVSVLRRQTIRCSVVVVTLGTDGMDMIWIYRTT